MRPAVSRFAARMDAELTKHEGERKPPWNETKFADLEESLKEQIDKLHWAIQARLKAKTEDELNKAREAMKKSAAHVGNYAMFIHDNAAMKRSL